MNSTANDMKVLACVDRSRFADYVADYAGWAARRLAAPLELLHVIDRRPELGSGDDHSGAIGINAQEQLLDRLSSQDEIRSRNEREAGRTFLNRLRERVAAVGAIDVDVRQRHGNLHDTLVDQQDSVRLFVLGKRGESADSTRRDLGRQVERVVRAVERPIFTITEAFTEPRRVLIAFDDSSVTRKGVEMVASSPLFRGLTIDLLMSGQPRRDGARQLEWAKQMLVASGFDTTALLLPGDTESTIARTIQERASDVLVMGAYTHSPLRSLFLGSRTTDLLRAASIPTLLLR